MHGTYYTHLDYYSCLLPLCVSVQIDVMVGYWNVVYLIKLWFSLVTEYCYYTSNGDVILQQCSYINLTITRYSFCIFLFKYDSDRSITHYKFDPTGIQTHDSLIMDCAFHVPEMLTLTAEPSLAFISSFIPLSFKYCITNKFSPPPPPPPFPPPEQQKKNPMF